MKRTVIRMMDEASVLWSDQPYALKKGTTDWISVSFSESRKRSREFAAWLVSKGFKKGDRLAILAEGSPEWIMAESGILCAACVSVPLSIKLLAEEIPFRLDHSEARAILTTKNQLEKVLGSFAALKNKEMLLLYLDDDPAFARTTAAKFGLAPERVVGFDEAREAGRRALELQGSTLTADLDAIAAAVEEDDTVNISYTSGTTGNPKGIMGKMKQI